jgi:hypothetical protein
MSHGSQEEESVQQMRLGTTLLLLTLPFVALGGCGTGLSPPRSSDVGASSSTFRIPVGKVPYRREGEMKPGINGLMGPEAKPILPDAPPPEYLALQDLIQGIGHMAHPGRVVTIQYVGVDYETGKKFDSSWAHGRPFTFTLGLGEAIEGLEEGVEEMEVGDRREIVIPPRYAHGGQPAGKIPQDSTSVFVVDMLAVR